MTRAPGLYLLRFAVISRFATLGDGKARRVEPLRFAVISRFATLRLPRTDAAYLVIGLADTTDRVDGDFSSLTREKSSDRWKKFFSRSIHAKAGCFLFA